MQRVLFFTVCFIGCIHVAFSQKVRVEYDTSVPQAVYAAERLKESLVEQGYSLEEEQAEYVFIRHGGGKASNIEVSTHG